MAAPSPAPATPYPEPHEATGVARDFRFHTGEVMPELRLGYLTIGEPSGTPVLVLHGSAGSSRSMVSPAFAGQLFGPGQAYRQCTRPYRGRVWGAELIVRCRFC